MRSSKEGRESRKEGESESNFACVEQRLRPKSDMQSRLDTKFTLLLPSLLGWPIFLSLSVRLLLFGSN